MRAILVSSLSLTLVACGSSAPPPVHGPTRTLARIDAGQGGVRDIELVREDDTTTGWVNLPAEEVWRHLPAVYEELGIEAADLSTFNSVAHQIGISNERMRRVSGKRPSAFVNCGHSLGADKADRGHTTISLTTWLEPHDGGTWVRTRLQALARDVGTSTQAVTCTTRGRLEKEIMQRLQLRIARGGA